MQFVPVRMRIKIPDSSRNRTKNRIAILGRKAESYYFPIPFNGKTRHGNHRLIENPTEESHITREGEYQTGLGLIGQCDERITFKLIDH